ncbi:MAG: HAMP domain-containing histidine kinase [Candidatus Krumholzibacteriota bacterium]|nr:HAMP domain-containing histidine kinase [Candidatus Krumholzibacteriota bacterium]
MRLGRHTFAVISLLVVLGLAGLICVQVVYLARAYDRELRVFTQNVNGALRSVAGKLEARETGMIVSRIFIDAQQDGGEMVLKLRLGDKDSQLSREEIIRADSIQVHKILKNLAGEDHFSEGGISAASPPAAPAPAAASSGGSVPADKRSGGSARTSARSDVSPPAAIPSGDSANTARQYISVVLVDTVCGASDTITGRKIEEKETRIVNPDSINTAFSIERRYLVEKALHDLSGRSNLPINERIAPARLDSIIAATLEEAGIRTEYAYGILAGARDSLLLAVPERYRRQLRTSPFKTRLFPHDLISRDDRLLLYFPRQSTYLLGREGIFLLFAFFSIALIAGCFIYVVRTLRRQKRFSRQLTDFITNMTHEFKTPLSTISLVGENITAREGEIDRERLRDYGRIVSTESGRLRHQVEKILEMAALEEGDFTLDPAPFDLHQLLRETFSGLAMRIEGAGGEITMRLEAQPSLVEADRTHLENVILNLLDNAVNYTARPPRITVSTSGGDEEVIVSIEDNGVGIGKNELKHIFDRYYRVPTGNLHDVKGFGLGLSYVKLIVEAHGGSLAVKSVPGSGSTFTLRIPRRFGHGPGGSKAEG